MSGLIGVKIFLIALSVLNIFLWSILAGLDLSKNSFGHFIFAMCVIGYFLHCLVRDSRELKELIG